MTPEFETPSLQDVYHVYSMNHAFYLKSFDRISDTNFSKSLVAGKPTFQWIAAHLANTKCHAANRLGADFELRWDKEVGGMTAVYKDGVTYPSKNEILEVWNPVTDRYLELLTQTTDVQLEQSVDFQPPGVPATVQGLITFLAFHESYHIGQLGMLVSQLGDKPLAKPD